MNVKVRLQPIMENINLPTVIKTAILPGDLQESLFIATQVGEILLVRNGIAKTFLDIRSQVIHLGKNGGYDERGFLGLTFHPNFSKNGKFYIYYSAFGSEGTPPPYEQFRPDPCDPNTFKLQWNEREKQFDHIDTLEEWELQGNSTPKKRRTLLRLRRPFFNHNGVNNLTFSPETKKLVLITGDGGSGFDPFCLSQDIREVAGKMIKIDVDKDVFIEPPKAVTRFNELPFEILETMSVVVKGIRNSPGISYVKRNNEYLKFIGQVGQETVESIFCFKHDKEIPLSTIHSTYNRNVNDDELINLGWRGWEGSFPTPVTSNCPDGTKRKTIAYYDDSVKISDKRIEPFITYFHEDFRINTFAGTALTGIQVYMGHTSSSLAGTVVFSDYAKKEKKSEFITGALAYAKITNDRNSANFHPIEVDHHFGKQQAHFVSLGTNMEKTRLFLGVYHSTRVTDYRRGSVFEVIPT